VRTLVVSDLHLGARTERDVLRAAGTRARLIEALDGVERLVLLGDVIELRHGPVREALALAEPVLRAIGAALGDGAEVVVVPGNHDHHLIEPCLERAGRKAPPGPLGSESAVDWRAGETLASLARALAPARVRAAYPGVWLRADVYATHGHYIDRHTTVPLFERLGAGVMALVVREPASGPMRAEDYEAALAPIYAWIHSLAQTGSSDDHSPIRSSRGVSASAWRVLSSSGRSVGGQRRRRASRRAALRRRAAVAGFPVAVAILNRLGVGPLRADISGAELRRASLRAFGEVVARLGVDARYAIFGHTHRAGPLPGDDLVEWTAPGGAAMVNTGSWVHEPTFLGADPGSSPYRAGFAVRLVDGHPPELVNLLD
jgi:predicted phosphodiesterase